MVNKGLFYLPRDTIRVIYDDSPDYSEYGANKFMVLLLRMHPLGFTPEEGLASFINDLGAPQQNFFELLAEDGWLVRAQGKYYVDTGPLEMELDFYPLEHILRTYLEYRGTDQLERFLVQDSEFRDYMQQLKDASKEAYYCLGGWDFDNCLLATRSVK